MGAARSNILGKKIPKPSGKLQLPGSKEAVSSSLGQQGQKADSPAQLHAPPPRKEDPSAASGSIYSASQHLRDARQKGTCLANRQLFSARVFCGSVAHY